MKKLLIIDSNAIIHRAFHALPPLKTKDGEIVGAVYGFLLAFFRAIDDFSPDYVAAAFDYPAPTFRHKEYKEYKAKRIKAPDELYEQIPKVKDVLTDFGIRVFEKKGFEADDLIGTIAKKEKGLAVIVLTGDMDMLQLVDKNISINVLNRGVKESVMYNEEKVKERYGGLKPAQLTDYKGLRGDPSDNIIGVVGIGDKTAISLISEFGSIENLYKNLDKVAGKLKDKLKASEKDALFSKKIGTVKTDVPLNFTVGSCAFSSYNNEKVRKVLERYGFRTLIKRIFGEKEGSTLKLI